MKDFIHCTGMDFSQITTQGKDTFFKWNMFSGQVSMGEYKFILQVDPVKSWPDPCLIRPLGSALMQLAWVLALEKCLENLATDAVFIILCHYWSRGKSE